MNLKYIISRILSLHYYYPHVSSYIINTYQAWLVLSDLGAKTHARRLGFICHLEFSSEMEMKYIISKEAQASRNGGRHHFRTIQDEECLSVARATRKVSRCNGI